MITTTTQTTTVQKARARNKKKRRCVFFENSLAAEKEKKVAKSAHKTEKKLEKIYGEPMKLFLNRWNPYSQNNEKNTKKQPRELMFNTWSNPYPYCYKSISRDSVAPARPPEASSTQLPPLGRAPGGNTWHLFVRASFLSFFRYFGCRGSIGSKIASSVHHIFLPKKKRKRKRKTHASL